MPFTRPAHLFVSSSDGYLYDTRVDGWHKLPPLRRNYEMPHREINSVADLKATLRHGPYAWPGGYPMHFIANDCEAMSFATVRAELRQIIPSTAEKANDGWRIVACDINYEDNALFDAHTGEQIPAAYGEPEPATPETAPV